MTTRGEAALIGTIPIGALPAGTYRVLDGRLYRVEPGLPPSLDTRDAEIATLRTRAEQAEAERDEARALKVPPSVDELNAALMKAAVARVERDVATARAEAAEAEVARLEALFQKSHGVHQSWVTSAYDNRDRAEQAEAEVARLRGAREAALREAAGVLRNAAKKHRDDAEASRSVAASGGHVLAADILDSYANVIELLDAAPDAEGGE